ncbi:zinc metalloproteinase-disintegrin-like MTP4 isoform X2 [Heterodontus francisci]|uniref:zinc metalloproteinase-disintegrin-like MTP4 isoform X2 n=1 Tax=Heterodontus francisci TaxID=7792 RepID=UPI00355BF64C
MVNARCLFCSLLLCSLALEFVTSASKLPDVQSYQVVKPRLIHTRQKRESEGLYPAVLQFGVTVEGKERVLHLEKNGHLIANNYSETYYLENGTEVMSSPLYPDHCYYHGYIKGEGDSSASFSTCDGFSGYIRTNGQRYLMEPLKESVSKEHALYKYEELRLPLKTCGVVNTTWDILEPRVEETFGSASERSNFLKAKKYIELYVVADYSEFRYLGSVEAVRSRVFEAVNHINLLYKALKTHVALIGLEIWSSGDKISVEADSGQTLNNILTWRVTQLLPKRKHDNIQFLTYVDFTGSTIGLAQVSAMCTGNSGAINQDHTSNVHGVASTMAHEMGHNLGMNHDDNNCLCTSESCIMSPVLSSVLPTEFSSCSHQNFQSFTLTRVASCLRDAPDQDDIVSKSVCGNGFVEKGEECDCGYPKDCKNPCCDAKTCKLQEGAQCADGACCQNCKFTAAGSLCRRVKDDCDLPENCDGKSSDCPKDTFRLNGTPCRGKIGFCYNGKCPTFQEQCVSLWGAGAQRGPEVCFSRNKVGDEYSHCKKTTRYEPCSQQDVMCGQLNCVGGNARVPFTAGTLHIGRAVCRVVVDQSGAVSGLVENGMKCGDNKMCLNSKCAQVQPDDCSAKCPEHAVCNHLRECQYEKVFGSPAASTFPSVAVIIVVLVAALLMVAVGIGVFRYKKRAVKNTATPRTQQDQTSGLSNPAFTDSAPGTPQRTGPHNPKGPVRIAPPPPPYVKPATAPYAPSKPPGLRASPQAPAFKPPQPPASKVLMPPTKPRN